VALRHSYHGRSAMAMTLTGQGTWRLGPSQAGVVHAHNAYCYRCPFGLTYPDCEVRCASDLEELIRTTTGGQIAGFIAELGVNVRLHQKMQKKCRRYLEVAHRKREQCIEESR
jgi:4-aminobutyrate aminotransferase-like enzyme